MTNWNEWYSTFSKQKNALVLGGGGARGCYEIGLWKALVKENVFFDATAGTSIGALVGAMYVQGSLAEMINFVDTIKPEAIAENMIAFPEKLGSWVKDHKEVGSFLQKYILSGTGMDISPLKDALSKMFNYTRFKASPINYACMTFNLSDHRAESYFKAEMTEEDAESIILASASCYPAFPIMKLNGSEYIDGGYWDNVPADLAVRMGAYKILAVDVEGPGVILPMPAKADVFLIKPMLPLGNFLDFSRESCMNSLYAGELEMGKLLGTYCGHFFTFDKSDQASIDFWNGYLSLMFAVSDVSISDHEIAGLNRWVGGYSESDLSRTLNGGRDIEELLEDLALLAGLDPLRVWNFSVFLDTLMSRLSEIEAHPLTPFKEEDSAHKRMMLISRIYAGIRKIGLKEELTRLGSGRLAPGEIALALVWSFMEDAYGKRNEKTHQSPAAG